MDRFITCGSKFRLSLKHFDQFGWHVCVTQVHPETQHSWMLLYRGCYTFCMVVSIQPALTIVFTLFIINEMLEITCFETWLYFNTLPFHTHPRRKILNQIRFCNKNITSHPHVLYCMNSYSQLHRPKMCYVIF